MLKKVLVHLRVGTPAATQVQEEGNNVTTETFFY